MVPGRVFGVEYRGEAEIRPVLSVSPHACRGMVGWSVCVTLEVALFFYTVNQVLVRRWTREMGFDRGFVCASAWMPRLGFVPPRERKSDRMVVGL